MTLKGKSNFVICVWKGPAVGQKKQQKPQRCNVRSMTSVVNNAGFSNDQIKSLIISLIKLTEGCCVVYLLFSFQWYVSFATCSIFIIITFCALNDLRLFPHYAAEEFENSSETCIKCFASTLRNRNLKQNNHWSLWICVCEKTRSGEWLDHLNAIVFE